MKSRSEPNKKEALKKLSSIGQEHLLQFWETLSQESKFYLLNQITDLDLDLFCLQKKALKEKKRASGPFEPFNAFFSSGSDLDKEAGKELAREGKVSCIVLAGGQGSRLRFEGPKGCYPISVIKKKTLFQLTAEKIKAASKCVGRDLPVAFMTSPLNHRETEVFFTENHYFGLKPSQVSFFTQNMWPLLDEEENYFLETPGQIAMGPNGNGEVFLKLFKSGILSQWKEMGIEIVSVLPVDNPLALPFDFELFGFHKRRSLELVFKADFRSSEEEKVGVILQKDNKPRVVEYSEIENEMLPFKVVANLGLYSLSLPFIEKVSSFETPLHVAKKAVKKITKEGKTIFPKEPNAWKFEKFIFDAFTEATRCEALLYPREESFAPLKNLEGEGSIQTVQAALLAIERKIYTRLSGITVQPSSIFELDAEFYYPTETLKSKWKGKTLPNQTYIEA